MATGQLYEVFARSTREDPLARIYARTIYDEENWIEMIVVERGAIISVIELEPLVTFEGPE